MQSRQRFDSRLPAGVLGIHAAVVVAALVTPAVFLLLIPDSLPSRLLVEALRLGWPGAGALALLLPFIWFTKRLRPDRNWMASRILICLVGYLGVWTAIANYKLNFFGNQALLPISPILLAGSAFLGAAYFSRAGPLLRAAGVMILLSSAFSWFGNWLPQAEGGFPTPEVKSSIWSMTSQQLADEGEKIIFGGLGQSKAQGAIGRGQCPLCHSFWPQHLSDRAPNLWGIIARKRVAPNSLEYIAESHVCPSCYVVGGFDVKGTEGRESPMPAIHKPPISLSLGELVAADTWLYVREGEVPPSPDEIIEAYQKHMAESEWDELVRRSKIFQTAEEHAPPPLLVTGEEPLQVLFTEAQCTACHMIPGIFGAEGTMGPRLTMKTSAPKRLKDPTYKGNARTIREYVRESVLSPSRHVVSPYPDNVMPKSYGESLTGLALERMLDYLAKVQEDQPAPSVD